MGHEHHEHDHEYMHEHNIPHEHHEHLHACDHGSCEGCAGCDPKTELVALMQYMVKHNAAHAGELATLAGKLREMGDHVAAEQVMAAVSDFEKGNMRLSAVLAAMNVGK